MPRVSRKLHSHDLLISQKDYNKSEIEFMNTVRNYMNVTGRKFPALSEIFEIMLLLGYRKVTIPIATNIQFSTYQYSERKDLRGKFLPHNKKLHYDPWEPGCRLIRRVHKDFSSCYGTYYGLCRNEFIVAVCKMNKECPHYFEGYSSLEDVKFVWEFWDESD